MTFCIGLTGGIGSGKTTVSNYFAKLGVPIIDADIIAHQLTESGESAYIKIVAHFGKSVMRENQTLDRQKLRALIFNHPKEKKWLENLLHPLIRQRMRELIAMTTAPYCICVIPLLAESKGIDFLDRILVIDTPLEQQIARIKSRDNVSPEVIQKIIDAQATQSTRLAIADDVLINDADLKALAQKVNQLHQHYLQVYR